MVGLSLRLALGAALLLTAHFAPSVRAAELAVDLELVLAVDISGSMDLREQQLQREGYIQAITHPTVLKAIAGGLNRRIAVAYVEWAGSPVQMTSVDWRVIDSEASARSFAAALGKLPYNTYRGTSISSALAYSSRLFDGNGLDGARRVIDVSGDGVNNQGLPVELVRSAVLAAGIVINGLPLVIDPATRANDFFPGLDSYYEDCVIGGPGSFMIAITALEKFAEAIRQKLILEIAGVEPTVVLVQQRGRTDCLFIESNRFPF